jgi:hypothetical protein
MWKIEDKMTAEIPGGSFAQKLLQVRVRSKRHGFAAPVVFLRNMLLHKALVLLCFWLS